MAWLWFFLVALAAVVVLALIRRCYGPGRVRRRLAYPLAVIERALDDALSELLPARRDAPRLSGPWETLAEVWVNPFEPLTERLLKISEADLASLGHEASLEHRRLTDAIRAWNAAAGRVERPTSLLPIILTAHRAAGALCRHLEEDEIARARSEADARVLVSLVGARALGAFHN